MRFAVAATLLLCLVGCGEEPAPTNAEYRDILVDRSRIYVEEAEELRTVHVFQLERAVDDLVKELEGTDLEAAVIAETGGRSAVLFARTADALDRYVADLMAIEPPEALREPHQEYIDALWLSIRGIGDTVDALTSASSFAAIDVAIGGSTFSDTQPRVDAACDRLETALADQGAPGSLHCGEG